mgnify:CR=1 FL=1
MTIWTLYLIVMTAHGERVMYAPTAMDWHRCRLTEMRTAASIQKFYDGNLIIGAACIRSEAIASCSKARDCA